MARHRSAAAVRPRSAFRLETLEPRVLFAADSPLAAVAAVDAVAPEAYVSDAALPVDVANDELVIVDADVPGLDALLADLAGAEDGPDVVVLDGGAGDADEALARLGDLLAGRESLGAVHLISHGGAGELQLAGASVTLVDLLAANATVGGWADAFADGADFLIYGCDVAAGETGRAFVDTLALLTGTDVAASTDLTGGTRAGGNWTLEYARGAVTTGIAPSQALQDDYAATLITRTVSSNADAGAGTLRQAILDSVAGDEIRFSGPMTIVPQSALPEIAVRLTIDATDGTGNANPPRVTIDGSGTTGADGLVFRAGSGGSTVRGLAIVNFGDEGITLRDSDGHTVQGNYVGTDGTNDLGNAGSGIHLEESANNRIGGTGAAERNVVSGNGSYGIHVVGTGSTGNAIEGNRVGTNAAGDATLPNASFGIHVTGGAASNLVGGDAGAGNLVSGNANDGIRLYRAGADNRVSDNVVGLAADGVTALRNEGDGISVVETGDALIGRDAAGGAGNTVSGNRDSGVYVMGNDVAGTSGNTVAGNRIGTAVSGDAALGNGGAGVRIEGGARDNGIGGAGANDGNVVSGNLGRGIHLERAGTGNRIAGNLVGLGADGAAALGNGGDGIGIIRTSGTVVGLDAFGGAANTVSDNTGAGVYLTGQFTADTHDNTVAGNRIGTDVTGTLDRGNTLSGVIVWAGSHDNTVGGSRVAGFGNLISGNAQSGVFVHGADSDDNLVLGNRIGTRADGLAPLSNDQAGVYVANGASGTRIGGTLDEGNTISGNAWAGVTLTGAGTGSTVSGNLIGLGSDGATVIGNGDEGVLVFRTSGALIGADGASLAGNTISGNTLTGVLLDGGSSADTSGNTVAGNRIGTDATGALDRGNALTGVSLVNGASANTVGGSRAAGLGNVISGNGHGGIYVGGPDNDANRILGNRIGTSADGASRLGNDHDGILVADGATGTRVGGTVDEGNTVSGNDRAGVALSLAGTGSIVSGNLVGLGDDGDTVLGNRGNGVTVYRTSGAWLGADGVPGAPGTTLAGNTISGNGDVADPANGTGLVIAGGGPGASGNTVAGNRIGTDATGAFARANSLSGVSLVQGASENTVGGERGTGLGNLISGNGHNGVFIGDASTDGNLVLGNLVGTTYGGTAALSNGRDGVHVREGATDTRIGGALAEGNTVSGNAANGIVLDGAGAGSTVSGNLVGLGDDGTSLLGNAGDGVLVRMTSGALVGADSAGLAGNTVSDNAGSGVLIDGASVAGTSGNTVAGNFIGTDPSGTLDRGNGLSGVALIDGASANTIGGSRAAGLGNLSSGNGHNGVFLGGAGTDGNRILGNLVGTDAIGTSALGNDHGGVFVGEGVAGTVIGGTDDEGNVIAANGRTGIALSRAGAGSVVSGNSVGLGSDGTTSLGNGVAPDGAGVGGVVVFETAGALIGSDDNGRVGNTISGNAGDGVELYGADASGNTVAGNRIGTDASGTLARPNTGDGVLIQGGAHDNLVGSALASHGNHISGNAFDGVEIRDPGTDRNTVAGNVIGLAEGTGAVLPNGRHGVLIHDGAQDSRIGGDGGALSGNVISGNGGVGVKIDGNGGANGPTSGHLVTGNRIGTDVLGSVARPNVSHGVHIVGGASGNVVGGANALLGNQISGNGISDGDRAHGVLIYDLNTSGNRVQNNVIGLNADGDAALPNTGDGVNVDSAPGTVVGGAAGFGNVISGNGNDGLEILNVGAAGTLVGDNIVGLNADGTAAVGNDRHGIVIYRGPQGTLIGTDGTRGAPNTVSGNGAIGIAIDGGGGAGTRLNTVAGNFIGTGKDGRIGLGNGASGVELFNGARENAIGGADAMRNVISANDVYGVRLEGDETTANTVSGNLVGTDIDGEDALGNARAGIRIDAGANGNTIGGDRNAGLGNLVSGNREHGIVVQDEGTDDNRLLGNRIGTNAAGDAALPNARDGVFVRHGAERTIVGGAATGLGNLVSGNGDVGIEIIGTGTDDTIVIGNRIGTNAAGDAPVGNDRDGIMVYDGVQGTRIGGSGAGEGNLISGNARRGITIDGADGSLTRDNVIVGNRIGTDADGTAAVPNLAGIWIENGATANTIGGDRRVGEGNLVSGNLGHGVRIQDSGTDANVVTGNDVGTDLTGTGALPNGGDGIGVRSGPDATVVGGDRSLGLGNLLSANAGRGVLIETASGTTVAGNLIGTDAAGANPLGNGSDGVRIGAGSPDTTIGGGTPGLGNTVSDSGDMGIEASGAGTTDLVIVGNRVGTTSAGDAALGNRVNGIVLHSGLDGARVGGAGGEANQVSGNLANGIVVDARGISASGNRVQGNLVGLDATGTAAVPNDGIGILVQRGARENQIGGNREAGLGNTVAGNGADGVRLAGSGTELNAVVGNRIGTNEAGTGAIANGGNGVTVSGGAVDARIGGDRQAGLGNLISGNDERGIEIAGAGTQGTRVMGNRIGTDADGLTAIGNFRTGIRVHEAGATAIGGGATGTGNLVSGNNGNGIEIDGVRSGGTSILGNVVGLDSTGAAALKNENDGIRVDDSVGTRIGSAGAGNGNAVSGNDDDGISVGGSTSSNTIIAGNRVGTDIGGTLDHGNGGAGIRIEAGDDARIGGTGAGTGNLVSGNDGDGIAVQGTASNTVLHGNRIGTNAIGDAALGNDGAGVRVSDAAHGTLVGGTAQAAGNLISANGSDGVRVDDADDVAILNNRIGTNANGDAALPNDGAGIRVSGDAERTIVGRTDAGNLVSGNDEQGIEIGGADVLATVVRGNLVGTDASGTAALANGANGVRVHGGAIDTRIGGDAGLGQGNLISGHAGASGVSVEGADTSGTLIEGNRIGTSTDGDAVLANGNGVTVSNASGTRVGGAGSDRGNLISGNLEHGLAVFGAASVGTQVLGNRIGTTADGLGANANGRYGIHVSGGARQVGIGGADAGSRNLVSGNASDGIWIGSSADVAVLGNFVGVDAGGNDRLANGRDGIRIGSSADGVRIGGAGVGEGNIVSGNVQVGINVGSLATDAAVAGNTVGLGADGTTAVGNGSQGVLVAAADTAVGGVAAGAGNVISANGNIGLLVTATDGTRVLGNTIGLDRNGTADRGNALAGIAIRDSGNVTVGQAGAGNTISGNGGDGVEIARTSDSIVAGNRIGTSADGTLDIGNDRDGVRILDGSADNLVGGTDAAAGNTIRASGGEGIAVLDAGSTGNALLLNVIGANDGLGIDLGGDGVDANDALDADTGPNELVNRPTLLRVGTDGAGRVEIDGRVETTPNTDVRVDVYATGPADPSGHGGAQRHLGSVSFRTDGNGVAEGRLPLSATLAPDESVTATTTLMSSGTPGSTSEFAENVVARELDVAPTITSGDFTVAENVTVAGTITADDANGDPIVYSVSGGTDAAAFSIDSATGVLSFVFAPDAEAPSDTDADGVYEVRVAASDGWTTVTRDVAVTVTDVDEADTGPVSDVDPAASVLAEDAAVGTAAGITASADDADVDDSVSYALSVDAGGLFAIDATSGVVTLVGTLDAESATSHEIAVRATSTDGSISERTFTIDVADVDEFDVTAPVDADASSDAVSEGASNGDAVGLTARAEDADETTDAVTYSLADSAGGRFTVDSTTGTVSVADAGLLDAESATSHDIVVRATSADGSTADSTFTIGVADADEFDVTAPVDVDGSPDAVSEAASSGDAVGLTVQASDADETTDTVGYGLEDDAGGRFAIDSVTGVVTVADASLLDAESDTSHDIVVRATSADGSTADSTFTIDVTDANEFDVTAPTDVDGSPDTVSEVASDGDEVGLTVRAEDADETTDTVTYSLADTAGGRFAIDSVTGVVTVADTGLLDAESDTSHDIVVRASSADGSTADTAFTIDVTDADEFDVTAPADVDDSPDAVSEVASDGDAVGLTAQASDADETTSAIGYDLENDAGGRFAIDSATGVVIVADAGLLDAERDTSHDIVVRATSADGSTADSTFTIGVADADEFDVTAPADVDDSPDAVSEAASDGDAVGLTARAEDADETTDAVIYSLADSAGGRFAIDAITGAMTVADASLLDAESDTSHDIVVRATSADGSTADSAFTIDVTDADEFDVTAPTDVDGSPDTVSEVASDGDEVGLTVRAEDADETTDTVTYSLADTAGGRFDIDSATGVVRVAGADLLDAETNASHDIVVRATSADGSVSERTFAIAVTDVDESDVGEVSDVDPAATVLPEDAATGSAVGITASADDDDRDDSVAYSLASDASGLFSIDATSGVLTLAGPLDAERATSHDVTVRATSTDGSISERTFAIDVADVDEFDVSAPVDADASSDAVPEGASNGDEVGVTARAEDADETTDAVTYSLADSAGGRFTVDSTTGMVTVADAGLLDAESATSHDIVVRAASADGSTADTAFTIEVTDVNESAPTIASGQRLSVEENAPAGAVAGSVAARDPDVSGGLRDWAIDGGDGAALFAIDAVTGEVRVADGASLDAESVAEYRLEVSVGDGSRRSPSVAVTVAVDDVNEAPVMGDSRFEIDAGYAGPVGTLEALDPDSGDALAFEIVSTGARPDVPVAIDVGGTVRVDAAPPGVYSMGVRVVDPDGASAVGTLTIAVEAAPVEPVPVEPVPVEPVPVEPEAAAALPPVRAPASAPDPVVLAPQPSIESGGPDPIGTPATGYPRVDVEPDAEPDAGETDPGERVAASRDRIDGVVGQASLDARGARGLDAVPGVPGLRVAVASDVDAPAPTLSSALERTALAGHRLVLELLLGDGDDAFGAARSPVAVFDTLRLPIALTPQLLDALELLRSEMDGTEEQERARATLVAAAAAVTGGSLTAGFVTWLLRSGLLLAAAASTTPLWRPFDPVPILAAARRGRDDDGIDEGAPRTGTRG